MLCLRIRSRGPDHATCVDIAGGRLAACRLGLRGDLEETQPLTDVRSKTALAFNGEIYNTAAILQRWSPALATEKSSDTRVLFECLSDGGAEVFWRAEGMFAAASVDPNGIMLARDQFGIKPLYYWLSPNRDRFYFGSEIKALLGAPEIPRQICPQSFLEYLIFGCPLNGKTLFSDIHQVQPGEVLKVELEDDGKIRLERTIPVAVMRDEACSDIATSLAAAVAACIETTNFDVGLLLSGGIDSSLIASFHPSPKNATAITITDGRDVNGEEATARLVARHFGFRHVAVRLRPEVVCRSIAQSIAAHELPLPYSAIHAAGESIGQSFRTLMTGDGADELFLGYGIHRSPSSFVNGAGTRCRAIEGAFKGASNLLTDSKMLMASLLSSSDAIDHFLLRQLLVQKHLKFWDKGAMAHSIEIRLPFLTRGVANVARNIPRSEHLKDLTSKGVLRNLVTSRFPWSIATQLLRRPKVALTGATARVRSHLISYAQMALPRRHVAEHPFRAITQNPLELMSLDLFFFLFLRHGGVLPAGFDLRDLYSQGAPEITAVLEEACAPLR